MNSVELQAKLAARRQAREAAKAKQAGIKALPAAANQHAIDAAGANSVPQLRAVVAAQATQIKELAEAIDALMDAD